MPNTNNKIFNALVDELIEDLGHYDSKNFSICMYDYPDNAKSIEKLHKRIQKITNKYRLIVLPRFDKEWPYANINILDINL